MVVVEVVVDMGEVAVVVGEVVVVVMGEVLAVGRWWLGQNCFLKGVVLYIYLYVAVWMLTVRRSWR